MAWFPGAIRKVVTRHRTPITRHRGVCLHVAVSEAASLFGYFNQPGNPTSHFYVRRDGTAEQYVDTQLRAPAQLEGNPTMIGIETQGGVLNPDTERWTPDQVNTLANLARWCHDVHGIPLVAMPDSRPERTGIGWHRLGIDPWRVDGGERWSEHYGKICPGAGKIAQIPNIITLATGGDDMANADEVLSNLLRIEKEQDDRYTLDTKRYADLVDRLNLLLAARIDVDAFADLVVGKLPADSTTIDLAALKQAVKDALREGVGT